MINSFITAVFPEPEYPVTCTTTTGDEGETCDDDDDDGDGGVERSVTNDLYKSLRMPSSLSRPYSFLVEN